MKKNINRRKVLLIGGGPPPYGGGEEMMEILIKETPRRSDIQLVVLNTRDPRGTANRGKLDLMNIYLGLAHSVRLFFLLLIQRPALVYLSISRNAIMAFFRDSLFIHLSVLFGARVVGHLHGSYFDELYDKQAKMIRWYMRITMARVTDTIILGESLRYNFNRFLPEDRIHVVFNGIDGVPYWQRRTQYLSSRSIRQNDCFKVLFVGVLKKSKGYHILLQALPKILQHRKDIRLQLAGEWFLPEEKAESLAFVKCNHLERQVEFLGIIRGPEKYRYFAEADVFAFPTSYIEGHPIVIVEAMASGLPVISTQRGSIPEYVINGQTGYIIPENDPNSLSEKILLLMADPKLRQQIGAQSRAMFEARFTKDHFVDGVTRVWHHAMRLNESSII